MCIKGLINNCYEIYRPDKSHHVNPPQSNSLLSRSLTYPNASDAAAVDGGEAVEVAIATPTGTAATSPVPLQLKPETLTDIFVIGGLNAPQPLEIVVAEA